MKCCLTGAAGFIGSHVGKKLVNGGWSVRGVDNFADFYPRAMKEAGIAELRKNKAFELVEADLVSADTDALLDGCDAVIHLAAQAGVRTSWGREFRTYTDSNILATQRLLESCRDRGLKRFVYASSSSVYGETQQLPLTEDAPLMPLSPYGVSKLAAERLCRLYFRNFGVPTISFRYFTVYGPGQRPDMSFHRFIRAMYLDEPFRIFGTGEQTRDFTYVGDIADVTVAALEKGRDGEVYNIGGGNRVSLNHVVRTMAGITGAEPRIEHQNFEKGDMMHTMADTGKAAADLDYSPSFSLEEGLRAEAEWIRTLIRGEGR